METELFAWDDEKAAWNLRIHGVSFEEAITVFADPLCRAFYDPDHSVDEDRHMAIGESSAGGILVVSYTYVGDKIRVISAREAAPRERRSYEEEC